jgi:hypothetical protein
MKKFFLFTALIWLGFFKLAGQQIMPNQPVGQVQQPVTTPQQPVMQAGQPVTTPGQPVMQAGQPFTQGQPIPGANSGLTLININMVVLGQAATSTNNGPMAFHFTQSTIGNNEILGLINDEFGTSFSTTNGDQLAVRSFFDGKIMVVGPTNNVLLDDASTTANNDHYQLNFSSTNTVSASQVSTNATTIFSVTAGSLNYVSGDGTNSFHLQGLTMINDLFFNGSVNSMETFQLTGGIGSSSFPGTTNNMTGVLTGNITGFGQSPTP